MLKVGEIHGSHRQNICTVEKLSKREHTNYDQLRRRLANSFLDWDGANRQLQVNNDDAGGNDERFSTMCGVSNIYQIESKCVRAQK